jgi:hypothetical protein
MAMYNTGNVRKPVAIKYCFLKSNACTLFQISDVICTHFMAASNFFPACFSFTSLTLVKTVQFVSCHFLSMPIVGTVHTYNFILEESGGILKINYEYT